MTDEASIVLRIREHLDELRDRLATESSAEEAGAISAGVESIRSALYYPLGYEVLIEGEFGAAVRRFEEQIQQFRIEPLATVDYVDLYEAAVRLIADFKAIPERQTYVDGGMFEQFESDLRPARDAINLLQRSELRSKLASTLPLQQFSDAPEVRYQVFLSSTFSDLQAEREKVTQELLRTGKCIPAGMELFGASAQPPWDLIKSVLDVTDYFLLVLGSRYGSIPPGGELSYTEMEYDYATSHDIPVLAFLAAGDRKVEPQHVENSSKQRKALQRFVNKVQAAHTTVTWTTADDLSQKATTALWNSYSRAPRPGWVRREAARLSVR